MSETKILFPGVKPGETFRIGDMEFIRFADCNGQTPVVMKDIAFRSRFGDNNDFRSSDILKRLQEEVLPQIIEAVGEENVCEFETDLTTLDGLKNYGTMRSRISIPTFDFYRANVAIFDQYNPDTWWWLATADSAKPHYDPIWINCVSLAGLVNGGFYFGDSLGVRPFCILKSSIFES
jgi:hypothetical protein